MSGQMKRETPSQKWSRLQNQIQRGISRAYANPERNGCINDSGIRELARRAAVFDDSIEDDPDWKHVTHCSPCYAQYLQEFNDRRRHKRPSAAE